MILDTNFLLTIGIPIYNGEEFLKETLNSIVFQVEKVSGLVEILVVDNASTDSTSDIILEYQKKYSSIRYIRNPVNLGFDRNYDKTIIESKGKYVWTFCADDIVVAGSIRKILTILEKYSDLSAVFVNYSVWDGKIQQCKDVRARKIFGDRLCQSPEDFYHIVQNGACVASSNIYNRELWLGVKKEAEFYQRWVQVEVLARLLIQNPQKSSYCIAEPLFILRQGQPEWERGGGLLLLTLNLLPIFQSFKAMGYPEEIERLLVGFIEDSFWAMIFSSKVNGLKVNIVLLRRIYVLTNKFKYFWILFFMLLCPSLFYMLVFRLARLIKCRILPLIDLFS